MYKSVLNQLTSYGMETLLDFWSCLYILPEKENTIFSLLSIV